MTKDILRHGAIKGVAQDCIRVDKGGMVTGLGTLREGHVEAPKSHAAAPEDEPLVPVQQSHRLPPVGRRFADWLLQRLQQMTAKIVP